MMGDGVFTAWVGINDPLQNEHLVYAWNNQTVPAGFWKSGHPVNPDYDCGYLSHAFKMFGTYPCEDLLYFVCEAYLN